MSEVEMDRHLAAELERVEAAGHLVMWQCIHCDAHMVVDEWDGGLPKVLGVHHEVDCPDALPEWPA